MGLSCRNSSFPTNGGTSGGSRFFSPWSRANIPVRPESPRRLGCDPCLPPRSGRSRYRCQDCFDRRPTSAVSFGLSEGLPPSTPRTARSPAPRGVLAEMAFVEQVLGEGLHNGEHLVHGILVLDSAIGRSGPVHGSKTRLQGLGLVSRWCGLG